MSAAQPPIVVDSTPMPKLPSLFELATAPDELARGLETVKKAAVAVLTPSDIALIGPRPFVRKSGWQRLALAFGIHTSIASTERITLDGANAAWRVTIRAHKTPCSVERSGLCTIEERRSKTAPNQMHTVESTAMAMAETRAAGRAICALFGFGDVSAEEVASASPETLTAISPVAEAAYAAQGGSSSSTPRENANRAPSPPTPEQRAELRKLGMPATAAGTYLEAASMIADAKRSRKLAQEKKQAEKKAESKKKEAEKAKPEPEGEAEAKPERTGPSCACGTQKTSPRQRGKDTFVCAECNGWVETSAAIAVLRARAAGELSAQAVNGSAAAAAAPPSNSAAAASSRATPSKGAKSDEGSGSQPPSPNTSHGDGTAGAAAAETAPAKHRDCTCEGDECEPRQPDDADAWHCAACKGGRLSKEAADSVMSRMRSPHSQWRTAGMPVPPYTMDMAKPPTKSQLNMAHDVGIQDDQMNNHTRLHVWGQICDAMKGRL